MPVKVHSGAQGGYLIKFLLNQHLGIYWVVLYLFCDESELQSFSKYWKNKILVQNPQAVIKIFDVIYSE